MATALPTAPPADSLPESSASYYGWRVVLAAYFGVMVSFASLVVYTFSIFLKPVSVEFGWSRDAISRAFGIAAMMVAFCSPGLGHLLDRFGPRRIVIPGMMIFGIAFASLGLLTPNIWHLYAIYFVLGAVGNATTQMGYSGAISSGSTNDEASLWHACSREWDSVR